MRHVHGWRRALRWVQAFFAIVLSLVLVVIAVASLILKTQWGRQLVKKQVVAQLNNTFIGGATLGDVRGNPLSELVLDDLVINGPDKQPAIKIKELKVKLPLMPLISHQLRVDEVIANDVDVILKRQQTGGYQIAHLTKPGPKSTWNIALPDVQVHRGHIKMDTGAQGWIDLDHLELYVDASMPFAGPIDASVSLATSYRQKQAPIALGAVVHVGSKAVDVRSALGSIGKISIAVAGGRIPKGDAPKAFGGTVAIVAPADEVARLAPQIKLPADVAVAIDAYPSGTFTDLAIAGAVGSAPVRGFVHGDVNAKAGRGFVMAADLDLGAVSNGKLDGRGGAFVAFDVDAGKAKGDELPIAKAMVQTWGNLPDAGRTNAVIALDTTASDIRAALGAVTASGIRATVGANVTKHGKAMVLEQGLLLAATKDPMAASAGKAPVHGALDANISASGALSPAPDLTVTGHINGDRLRFKDITANKLRVTIDAKQLPKQPVGTARVAIDHLTRQDIKLDDVVLAAGNRPDGKLQVTLRTDPKPAPYRVDLDALVTPGDTIGVDLQRHIIRPGRGAMWHGRNAHIAIGPERIEVRNLTSASSDGKLDINATLGRKTGAIDANVDANIKLSALNPKIAGNADAHIAVQRAGGRFSGDVAANIHGFTEDPKGADKLDGTVKVTAKDGMLNAAVDATSTKVGTARIDIAVNGPRDMGNVAAWKTLTRSAVKDLHVQLQKLDVNQLGKALGKPDASLGTVNGDLRITPDTATGDIQVRGVRASMRDVGVIDADVKLKQTGPDELTTSAQARMGTYGTVDANAKLAMPKNLFDPAAWKRLGPGVIRGATLRSSEVSFNPGTLERFGIVSQFRGVASIEADVKPALSGASFAFDLHDFRGGKIVYPIAAHIAGQLDSKGIAAVGAVRNGSTTLVSLQSKIPVTVAQLRADPNALKAAPLSATIAIPSVPARELMAILGNTQLTGGTLDGKVDIAGTVGKPTAKALFTATNITVPSEAAHPVQAVRQLTIQASWDGEAGKVAINGDETGGGKLQITADARKDDLAHAKAALSATNVDLAPLVPLLPGPAGGLGGHLDANFQISGTDPRTAELGGTLALTEGRIPIAPVIGTLFHGDLRIQIKDHKVDVRLSGKLGKGDVQLAADAPLDGLSPTGGQAKLTLRKVQVIGTTEPIIDATVNANLARVENKWTANISVDHGDVKIPDTKGEKLQPVGAPPDIIYKGSGKHVQPASQVQGEGGVPHRKAPTNPIFIANITVKNTHVESTEVRGFVNGKLKVTMDNHEMAVMGNVWLAGGDLDLFDRRYQVERAALHFDGSVDPMLDVRIIHDFPEVTTITEVRGRMSKPDLVLSSQPATYSQAELLGFLLGGEPGGDPNQAPSAKDRVTGAGASFVANQIGGYVKKALPVDIDVLKYESASATSSAAIKVGTWITDTLFFAYREHINARPDENTGEGELEYWIKRRLVLQGTIGDRGYDGADLLWRRRW